MVRNATLLKVYSPRRGKRSPLVLRLECRNRFYGCEYVRAGGRVTVCMCVCVCVCVCVLTIVRTEHERVSLFVRAKVDNERRTSMLRRNML